MFFIIDVVIMVDILPMNIKKELVESEGVNTEHRIVKATKTIPMRHRRGYVR